MRQPLLFVFCLLPLALCLLATTGLRAQKFIQLERVNRAKTTKIYAGQDLTYRLKGEREWYTSTITDVHMDSQLVALDWKTLPVAEFERIRLEHSGFLRSLGPAQMVFGASWAGFSLIGAAFDDYKLTAGTAIVSGSTLLSGFILHQIFKNKDIRLGQRRRLRAVEVPLAFPGKR